jgi:glucose-1-phosphate cytidylyltransferase
VQAIILAGGLGTRMREETEFRPKPMVEIGGRPVLWHIMKHLSTHGIHDFVIALGYKGYLIKDYFRNYETQSTDITIKLGVPSSLTVHGDHDETSWTVTLVETGKATNTGGRVKQALRYVSGSPVLVVYGDTLADVDVTGLLLQHRSTDAEVTVTAVQPVSRFGVLDLDAEGRVRAFAEKPQLEGWINIGYMLLSRDFAFALREDSVLEGEPLMGAGARGRMHAFQHRGYWQPMDTYREYVDLNRLWESGQAPWKTW